MGAMVRSALRVLAPALVAGACAGPSPKGPTTRAAPDAGTRAPEPKDAPDLAARGREEARFAWDSYARHAWGHDELRPLSRSAHDWYATSLLITPVDTLDTLLLLGLDAEAR